MLSHTVLLLSLYGLPVLAPDGSRIALPAATASEDPDRLQQAEAVVRAMLSERGAEAVVTSRVKSTASVLAKMKRKRVPFEAIYDRLAVRVRVEREQDCYALLDALHGRFEHLPDELDDYIARPKANGYRSIHTVLLLDGGPVEIQIRTHAMHEHAENGAAAHTLYKQGAFAA